MKALLAVAILLALSAAVNTEAAPKSSSVKIFEAVAVPHRNETHLPPRGRNGDRDLLHWIIHDRHGNPFGIATLDCNWYRDHERMCMGVFRLARGSFVVAGNGQNRSFAEFMVVSGTGDYATPRGELHVNATARGKLIIRGLF